MTMDIKTAMPNENDNGKDNDDDSDNDDYHGNENGILASDG